MELLSLQHSNLCQVLNFLTGLLLMLTSYILNLIKNTKAHTAALASVTLSQKDEWNHKIARHFEDAVQSGSL